ncbi:putative membrane protein [Owenweeksia hongkongensis DSM 17368]|uniref:Putative membrane protein n=1 Tax=Owenweeksia hongkongensis (strain DSM 17368 / CIP 108786 / JCM 12287 / NRRL B-23963 / UST20020801) TaxID=926562 RepID=G8R1F9_OWEHD|nr:DoxX family protein [Owenweeksia hongkongensis]AEV33902.1 putative membrane protein [Owenweeksia hongkongensis DSM 17368]
MATIKSLNKWANAHTYYPLDLLRIGLGIFLLIKGVLFIGDSHTLSDLAAPLQGFGGFMLLIHYVAPAHLIGGILIIFGLLTRWAVIAQLPILFGAIIINFIGPMDVGNLFSSVLVMGLCMFFTVYGSGKHSVDYNLKMQQ